MEDKKLQSVLERMEAVQNKVASVRKNAQWDYTPEELKIFQDCIMELSSLRDELMPPEKKEIN